MLIKPINLFTYVLGFIFGSYAVTGHSLTALIISIVLLFHAFMSRNIINDRKT